MQNLQKYNKEKKTLLVNTTVLIALVKMSVFFSAFFIFAIFGISIFFREVFRQVPKIKNNKIAKQEEQKPTTTRKQDAKQK